MMATVVDAPTWAVSRDRVWHATESNIPPGWFAPGRTFCHVRTELSRTDRQPSERHHKVCPSCVAELAAMGELLPRWMLSRVRAL